MIAWFIFTMPSEEQRLIQQQQRAEQDSLARIEQMQNVENQNFTEQRESQITQPSSERQASQVISGIFSTSTITEESLFEVETPNYTAVFSNKGAAPISFTLKDHYTWDGNPIQLISDTTKAVYNFGFLSSENYNVDTQNLFFRAVNAGSRLIVDESGERSLSYTLELADNKQILLTYTFYPDNFQIGLKARFIGLSDNIFGREVDFGWTSAMISTEKDPRQENIEFNAYTYAGGELEEFKLDEIGTEESVINGNITWVATKNKFFTQLIKPNHQTDAAILNAELNGELSDFNTLPKYTSAITSSIPPDGQLDYQLYIGPLKYLELKELDENAYDMVKVSYGWLRWFSDPFVRFVIILFFNFFSGFISNYGVLVIIFATVVKLVLAPLTHKSYKSMAAMRELQPQLKVLQDKYKENPQKLQQETMKMYKKNKVNPLGGCLPNLLQFPILITLWLFFQNSIILRQESFLWASDLSAPDYILDLPFSIPFLGESLAGFVLLMTAAMFVQSRLTGGMSGGGGGGAMAQQMKVLQYIFPVMLLFIFNNFASGLSLYYLVFNVLSILQQVYINKTMGSGNTAEVAVK